MQVSKKKTLQENACIVKKETICLPQTHLLIKICQNMKVQRQSTLEKSALDEYFQHVCMNIF